VSADWTRRGTSLGEEQVFGSGDEDRLAVGGGRVGEQVE
jgi:hypothetical protein